MHTVMHGRRDSWRRGAHSMNNSFNPCSWRLISMIRAFTTACCTAFVLEPDVQGAGLLPPGMDPRDGDDVCAVGRCETCARTNGYESAAVPATWQAVGTRRYCTTRLTQANPAKNPLRR